MKTLAFGIDENIGTLIDRAAEAFPKASVNMHVPSAVFPSENLEVDFPTIARLGAEAAGWLAKAGIERGSVVGIVKRNHCDTALLAASAARMGAIPALLSPILSPEETRSLIKRLNPAYVIADNVGLRNCGDVLRRSRSIRTIAIERCPSYGIGLDALRNACPVPSNVAAPEAPMVITHTSGTTGVPKLVVHSARTISVRARAHAIRLPGIAVRKNDRLAAGIMWVHARAIDGFAAILHLGLSALALCDLSIAGVSDALESFQPTIVEALPGAFALWEPLAKDKPEIFGTTRLFVNSFDAVHPRLVRTFLDAAGTRFPLWAQAYGQSEAGGMTAALYTRRTFASKRPRKPNARSVGRVIPGVGKVRITDRETGVPLKRGRFGQFEFRSEGLALTYLRQEDLHLKRRRGDWWTTGDVGILTRLGKVKLFDRDVDWIPKLGSCLAIEDRLLDEMPDLAEVVIIRLGGRAIPVVCTQDGQPLDADRWARATAGLVLEAPVQMAWDEIPRTSTYKVRRQILAGVLESRELEDKERRASRPRSVGRRRATGTSRHRKPASSRSTRALSSLAK